MLYCDAVRILAGICGDALQGTSHNRDEVPGGILPVYHKQLQITFEYKQIQWKTSINNI